MASLCPQAIAETRAITISNTSCRMRLALRRSGIASASRWHTPSLRSAVKLKHCTLVVADSNRFGEVREDGLEHFFAHGIRDIPYRAAGGRLDEAMDVEPLVAMMTECDWTFAFRRPHAARDRLQADPMFVHRPDFDRGARVLSLLFSNGSLQFFLSLLRSALLAVSGWRGRGFWIEYPIATSASQPR